MPWYRTGTVTIAANATTVTGVGTNFAQNSRVGDGFRGPDGAWYEITNIASQTVLSILPAYAGGAVSANANWSIAPLQGYNKESADQLRAITNQFGGTLGVLGNQTNAAGVRTAIQAAKNGANSDITSITGLTTALAVNQGGTGGTTPATARTGLGLGTSSTLAATVPLTAESPAGSLPDTSVCRVAEAVWAARSNHGFYTGSTPTYNLDTLPNGWSGLVSASISGSKPPLIGTFFWIETQATYTGGSAIQTAVQYGGSAVNNNSGQLNPSMAIRIRNQPGTAWGPWGVVQTTQDVVSSNIDTTAGKLLNVGYMGIGGITCPNNTDLNLVPVGGITWVTSGTLNQPTGYVSGSIMSSMTASAAESFQFLSARNLNGRFAVRRRVGSSWGNWIEPYMPWNVVGTVSGTSTNVTGSVIERGSNTNGDFIKFADGTMICWGTLVSPAIAITGSLFGGFASPVQTFTFPSAFVAAPKLTATASNLTAFGVIGTVSTTATQGGVQFTAVTSQAGTAARRCDWHATGRWV